MMMLMLWVMMIGVMAEIFGLQNCEQAPQNSRDLPNCLALHYTTQHCTLHCTANSNYTVIKHQTGDCSERHKVRSLTTVGPTFVRCTCAEQ